MIRTGDRPSLWAYFRCFGDMDPLATEPLGDSDDETLEPFDCSGDLGASEHNSPKSPSTREGSPSASAIDLIEDALYTKEEHFIHDNGDISIHSSSKPIKFRTRSSVIRPVERHKKTVHVQCEGKKYKSTSKSNKKEKPPVCFFYSAYFILEGLFFCRLSFSILISLLLMRVFLRFIFSVRLVNRTQFYNISTANSFISSQEHSYFCNALALYRLSFQSS